MNDIAETRYAKSGDCHIAYQVLAKGRSTWSSFRVSYRTSSTAGKTRCLRTFTGVSLRSELTADPRDVMQGSSYNLIRRDPQTSLCTADIPTALHPPYSQHEVPERRRHMQRGRRSAGG